MNSEEHIEPAPLEKTVLRLEKSNKIWPFLIFNILLILVGINSIIHENYEAGLAFFLVAVLLNYINRDSAAAFFGTSSQALLVVLHISLFGAHPLALFSALIIYLIFKKIIEKSPIGSISIYLIIDSMVEYFNPIWGISSWTSFMGKFVLTHEAFYSFLTLIPLLYFFLKIERYFKESFSNVFLKQYGAYLTLGILSCILLPISYFNLDNEFAVLLIPTIICLILYFIGMINLVNRKPQSGFYIAAIPQFIILLEIIIIYLLEN